MQEALQSFAVSFMSSAVSKTMVSPLERLKVIYQTQNNNKTFQGKESRLSNHIVQDLRAIVEIEGVRGLFKGNLFLIARYGIQQGVSYVFNFNVFKGMKKEYGPSGKLATFVNQFMVAGLSGSISFSMFYFLDSTRTMYMTNASSAKALDPLRKQPLRVFNGFVPGFVANFVYRGLIFSLVEVQNRVFPNAGFAEDTAMTFFITVLAGTTTYPLDTSRKLMNSRLVLEDRKVGWLKVVRDRYKQAGVLGFYKGWMVNVFRSICGSMTLTLYERTMKALGTKVY